MSNDFGLASRQREGQATVLYPAEVFDDDDITETGIRLRPERVSFLRGFNFCTDLYRLLENTNSAVRARRGVSIEDADGPINTFLTGMAPPKHFAADTLNYISKLYNELPPELKKVKLRSENPQSDRYGLIGMSLFQTQCLVTDPILHPTSNQCSS